MCLWSTVSWFLSQRRTPSGGESNEIIYLRDRLPAQAGLMVGHVPLEPEYHGS
ncbi:MAG: hypothetical protein HY602_01920 [Parcubacteria group bacterium]|nr:hypothetical protein [Parcubacteria group bacterium]